MKTNYNEYCLNEVSNDTGEEILLKPMDFFTNGSNKKSKYIHAGICKKVFTFKNDCKSIFVDFFVKKQILKLN